MRASPIRLSKAQEFDLCIYVRDNYPGARLNDEEFARKASEALGLKLNRSHICSTRAAFSIPSSREVRTKEIRASGEAKGGSLAFYVKNLEKRVEALELWVSTFMGGDNPFQKRIGEVEREVERGEEE